MKWLLWLLLLVDIKTENRIYNATNTKCLFSCIETVGRHYGYRELYDISKGDVGEKNIPHGAEFIRNKGIKLYWSDDGQKYYDQLEKAVGKYNWPVIIGIRNSDGSRHCIVLVEFTDEKVCYIENSKKDSPILEWSRKEFDSIWTGGYIIILPTLDPQ